MSEASLQAHQEFAYSGGHDYRVEAPHLKHAQLYDALANGLRHEIAAVEGRGVPPSVLEIGAGDGAFVEPLLASGCNVTITEMSRPSIATLKERYGRNPRFHPYFDEDGSMEPLGGQRFGIILYASVLHHIPDYEAAVRLAVDRYLLPGGSLVTFQDPLWYPSLAPGIRTVSDGMYLSWRLTRGNLVRGIMSRTRRARGTLSDERPEDMVEYHVIRNGVDQDAVARLLTPRFAKVEISKYWSSHANIWQRLGERMHLVNTFAVWARNARPQDVGNP